MSRKKSEALKRPQDPGSKYEPGAPGCGVAGQLSLPTHLRKTIKGVLSSITGSTYQLFLPTAFKTETNERLFAETL